MKRALAAQPTHVVADSAFVGSPQPVRVPVPRQGRRRAVLTPLPPEHIAADLEQRLGEALAALRRLKGGQSLSALRRRRYRQCACTVLRAGLAGLRPMALSRAA